jgi:lysozyme family protein
VANTKKTINEQFKPFNMKTLPVSQRSIDKYQELWDCMRIDPKKLPAVIDTAKTILKYRKQFETAVIGTKIPWYFMGIVYMREDGCKFKGHIHNGDSLRKRTVNVPAGRPIKNPAATTGYSFIESAQDLILLKGWHNVATWSMPALLYYFEANNGFGYRRLKKPIDTPYLWSCTQHYQKGKFAYDGVYDAKLMDEQIGAAPLLKYLTDKTLGLV